MFCDQFAVAFLRHHEDVLSGDQASEPIKCHLNQRATGAEDVQELLRPRFLAHGPETTANSAGHDDREGVLV